MSLRWVAFTIIVWQRNGYADAGDGSRQQIEANSQGALQVSQSVILTLCRVVLIFALPMHSAFARCPDLVPGAAYPWQTENLLPGDKWADLSIKLDSKGRPISCKSSKSNTDSESLFYMCQAMLADGKFEPIVQNGKPVEGEVTRHMMIAGWSHTHADELARKKYFAEHSDEQPGCYP